MAGRLGGRPNSPMEWIQYLEGKLSTQRSDVRRYQTYYDSENTALNYAQKKFSEIFGDLFVGWRDNFCLPAGSPVVTRDGVLPIEKIAPGARVLTHDGTYQQVVATDSRQADHLIHVRTYGSPEHSMTGNHPVLVTKTSTLESRTYKYVRGDDEWFRVYGTGANKAYKCSSAVRQWVRADEVSPGDIVWSKVPDAHRSPHPDWFLRILGYYLAEGSVSDNGRLAFSFHANELEYQDEVEGCLKELGASHVTRLPTSENAVQVVTYSKNLCELFEAWGGRGAAGKRMDPEIFESNCLPALITMWHGDGTTPKDGLKQLSWTTTSLELAHQMQVLLLREGIVPQWRTRKAQGIHSESYSLTVSGESQVRLSSILGFQAESFEWTKAPSGALLDGWVGYAVASVTREKIYGTVYDIQVEESESFVLPGMFAVHNCPLVVDSVSERLRIQGFRMEADEPADKEANDIWQRNFLDAESNGAHIDALMGGSAYLTVWGDDEDKAMVVPESAEEVTVQYEPGSRRKRAAALKLYIDDWGDEHTTLWLPDGIWTSDRLGGKGEEKHWTDPKRQDNPLGVVPVVPLLNRTRLKLTPFSELAAIIPIQDAINKVAADALVASEFAAFPQRILSGVEPLPENPTPEEVEGARQEAIRAYIDRILTLDNPEAKWGQFEAADLGNYVTLIDMLVQHMASQSRVPFHYFLLNGGQAPSGESITAAEAGLVAKARERMLHFGESWEEAMRLAFKVEGDMSKAEAYSAEVIWDDPEYRSKAQLADSLLKMKELGVPDKQLQEEYGYTPQQIERFVEMREEEMKRQSELDEKYGPKLVDPLTGKPMDKPAGQPGSKPPARGEAKTPTAQDKSASVERQKRAA